MKNKPENRYIPTFDDISQLRKEVDEYNVQNQQPQQPFLQRTAQKFGDIAKDYGITSFATHAASSPMHLVENVLNLPKDLSEHPEAAPYIKKIFEKIPRAQIPEKINPENWFDVPDTSLNRGAAFLGDIIGIGGAENRLARGINALTRIGPRSSLARRALQGAAQGYITSSNEQPGGREFGLAAGAVAPYIHGLTKTQLGRKAVQISDEIRDRFSALYNNVLHRAEEAGVNHVPVPRGVGRGVGMDDLRLVARRMPNNSGERAILNIRHYLEDPSIRNAHRAQSAFGAIERYSSHVPNSGNAGRIANNWQERTRQAMHNAFRRHGAEDIGADYNNLTHQFREEGTHFKHPTIEQHRAGQASEADIATDLLATRGFARGRGGRELPGFRARHALEPVIRVAKPVLGSGAVIGGLGTALGAAGVGLPEWAKQLIEHSIR